MKNKVGVSDFVKRQTKNSGKTYTLLSFDFLANLAEKEIKKNNFKNGYRDGVIIVEIKDKLTEKFKCPFIKIDKKTKLKAEMTRRRPEEEAYIRIKATNGKTLDTGKVELILYRHDVLKETNENSTDCKWELISFHGIPKNIKKLPMSPITMMRNQLQLKGGTKGKYSSKEWADSVYFWQHYILKEDD